jgi:hypothetical protein
MSGSRYKERIIAGPGLNRWLLSPAALAIHLPLAQASNAMIMQRHVHVNKVWGIPHSWLIWRVLTMTVSAGIGAAKRFGELDNTRLASIATVAAGFTALLSLVSIGGRFIWASLSGPVIVNYMREYQLSIGNALEQVYNQSMYLLAGVLVIGLICKLLARPAAEKWFMTDVELAQEKRLAHEKASAPELHRSGGSSDNASLAVAALALLAVGIPLAWGVYRTLQSVVKFFNQAYFTPFRFFPGTGPGVQSS